jgi:methyltransferase (TIGR00027 family)
MSRIKDVSGTAFVVAEFRAEENGAVRPLYRDAVVGLFLNEESRDAAERVATSFPPVKDMVKVRTKYFDDMLERHIRSHFRQVVILGAGLDTRAVRKQAADVRYFEIDDAATLTLKQTCYEQQGVDVNVKFIPGNYVTDGLIDLLKRNDFDFDLPTYFIWEGNVMYLPLDSVKHTLAELRRCVKRFALSFDYMAEAVISKTTGDPGITRRQLLGSAEMARVRQAPSPQRARSRVGRDRSAVSSFCTQRQFHIRQPNGRRARPGAIPVDPLQPLIRQLVDHVTHHPSGAGVPADVLKQYNVAYTEKELKECISFDKA